MNEPPVKEWAKRVRHLGKLFEVYYERLDEGGFSGVQPSAGAEIQKLLKKIHTLRVVWGKAQMPEIFALYAHLEEAYRSLCRVYEIFRTHRIDPRQRGTYTSQGSTMSYSYVDEMIKMLGQLQENFENFHPPWHSLGHYLEVHNEEDLLLLRQLYQEWGAVVLELYMQAADQAMSQPELAPLMLRHVEELKVSLLVGKRTCPARPPSTVQQLLQMHNLVARESFPSLSAALAHLGIDGGRSKNASKILRLAATLRGPLGGFCAWSKLAARPLKQSLALLENFHMKPAQGLTEEIVENTRTIRYLPKQVSEEFFYWQPGQKHTYLLESLDGETFHFLTPWREGPYEVPSHWLHREPSLRVWVYQEIMNTQLPLEEPVVWPLSTSEHHFQSQKKRLVEKLVRAAPPDLESFVHSPQVAKIFRRQLQEWLESELTFGHLELSLTCLRDSHKIQKRFTQSCRHYGGPWKEAQVVFTAIVDDCLTQQSQIFAAAQQKVAILKRFAFIENDAQE